jgi:hypothetical protein
VSPHPDPGERERILARAKRYPYDAPQTSFLLDDRGCWELVGMRPGGSVGEALAGARVRQPASGDERDLAELDPVGLGDRTAVLAFGANRTAEALERKRSHPGFPAETPILVLRATLGGLDVVYSAHLSPYGSVGAALQRSPGTSTEVCVTLLTDAQVAALAETEPNYALADLLDLDLELEGCARLDRVRSYVSRHGCLVLDGSEVALAAIPARHRRLTALTEPAVLGAVARRLGHRGDVDDFILENVNDPERAADRTRELRRDARPLDWPIAHLGQP